MEPIITTAIVDDAGLHLRNAKKVHAQLKRLKAGTLLAVTIEKLHATRSLAANAYYFGCVLRRLSDHTGYSVDELHEWAKCKFLPKHRALCDGNGKVVDEYVIGGSTAKLGHNDFCEYVDDIRRYAAETLSLDIPDPDVDWRTTRKDAA